MSSNNGVMLGLIIFLIILLVVAVGVIVFGAVRSRGKDSSVRYPSSAPIPDVTHRNPVTRRDSSALTGEDVERSASGRALNADKKRERP